MAFLFISPILRNSKICCIGCSSIQEKEVSQSTLDQFLPLPIEVFGCLHKHVDMFLHIWAHAILNLKGTQGFHLSTLITFLRQKVSIILQRMEMSFILSRAIAIGLTTSWLSPLQDTPPIIMANLASCWFLTCNYGRPSTNGRLWTYIDFHNNLEPTWHPIISSFSFILFYTFP